MINLAPEYLAEVKRILLKHVSGCEIRVFGSRITEKCKKYSDLDLALVGDEKFDFRKLETLKYAFSESDLPFMVDILDWETISKEFRGFIINNGYEIIKL